LQTFLLTANQKIVVAPVGDIHFGSEGWPRQKFIDHMLWGMDRGAYFLGMGEPVDFASHSQQKIMLPLRDKTRRQISGWMTEATEELVSLISFTKGRWIGMLEGDHFWTFEDGTTCDQLFCKQLDTSFLGTMARIRLRSSDTPEGHPEADTIILAHHGIGSSRTSGGHLHRIEDLLKWNVADIYLMGHTHAKVNAPLDRQDVTPDGKHYHRTTILARTGGWQRAYFSHPPLPLHRPASDSRGSFAEKRAYTPSAMGGLCFGIGYEKIDESDYYRPTIHYSV
jgi:hypothetical protein